MSDLLEAIRDEKVEEVRRLLATRPNEANQGDGEELPLSLASMFGLDEIVDELLQHGALVEQCSDADGVTPLQLAAFGGHERCVRALLAHDAAVDAQSSEGKSALMDAAHAGSLGAVAALLSAGANVALRDAFGRTALHWAVVGEQAQVPVVELLVASGVDPQVRNVDDQTALDYARLLGKNDIADAIAASVRR